MKVYRVALIDEYIEREKIDKKEFCNRCNITKLTLERVYQQTMKITLTKILRIVRVLKIRLDDFLV